MKIYKTEDLKKVQKEGMKLLSPSILRITVGAATCGLAKGAEKVFESLKYELKKQRVKADVVVVGCNGLCYVEPIVEVIRPGKPRLTYGNLTEDRVKELVKAIKDSRNIKELLLMRRDEERSPLQKGVVIRYLKGRLSRELSTIKEYRRLDFFKYQTKIISNNAGTISPERIEEYIAMGGYQALCKALTSMIPAQVIDEVITSRLRGRGGAGFLTGIKWKACSVAEGTKKFVVCNGSEGDPEIGMHRSLLESDPHLIIEGMIIAGYAVGANEGYIYLNDRYLLAKRRLELAIEQAEKLGLLGKNILKSGFSFSINVKLGGGAYISGEETALLNALEGSFAEPRPRPPFPSEKGLFGMPTIVNNIETLANIPSIVLKGGKWYSGIGTRQSTGTKIVSLNGHVTHPCWVEVSLGTPLKNVVTIFGKGVPNGKKIKAFQVGGPSGGFLPAKDLKLKLDYEQLTKAGSLLGSSGLLIMDEDTDMFGMAKFLTDFFVEESCGKCTSCREGLKQLKAILANIENGKGTKESLVYLKRIAAAMEDTSGCALGKTAAMPILSVMKYFPQEIERRLIRKN